MRTKRIAAHTTVHLFRHEIHHSTFSSSFVPVTAADAAPPIPDAAQRLAARELPAGSPVMFQQWRDLLFLHWEYPATAIQVTLPEGLFVDTFGGKAYLGVVPFFMGNIRPRFLPAVPGISDFMEMNLRTYVHDRAGMPGVWFYPNFRLRHVPPVTV